MTKVELRQAWKLAKSTAFASEIKQVIESDTNTYWQDYLNWADGIAISRERRTATMEQVAAVIRYQCLRFNGSWDMEEWSQLMEILRRRVICLE